MATKSSSDWLDLNPCSNTCLVAVLVFVGLVVWGITKLI